MNLISKKSIGIITLSKVLWIFFIFLIILIIIEMKYYLFLTNKQSTIDKKTQLTTTIKPTASQQIVDNQENEEYQIKIISGSSKDRRDAVYEILNTRKFSYSGSGIKTTLSAKGVNDPYKIIGLFDSFETISNSIDRYLISKDPITKETLPRVRIVNKYRESPEGEPLETAFDIEIINPEASENKYSIKGKGSVGMIGWEEIEKKIKRGDVVALLLQRSINDITLVDENGNYIAARLAIRRDNENNY